MTSAQTDIGAILRAARESMGISVANAAMQTNLSVGIIEKLEANQFSQMTAPVFARGYLMSYTRFLKLDPEFMMAEFNRLGFKDTEIRLSSANVASQNHSLKRHHAGTWLVVLPLIALAGVVISQVFTPDSWLISQFKQAFSEERAQLEAEQNPAGSQTQITLQIGSDNPALSSEPASGETNAAPEAGAAVDTIEPPPLSLTSTENLNEAGETASVLAGQTSAGQSETPPPAQTEADSGAAAPAAGNTLQLRISSENWVEVRDKEHRIVASKVYQAGEVVEVPLEGGPYEFNIGRPEAASLSVKGEAADLMQYRVGKSRRFKVDVQ